MGEGNMDRQDIYVKTDKASEEIQQRKYKLSQALRSLLIMIDGTKTIGSYITQAVALGDVSSMLLELEQQGFIKKNTDAPRALPTSIPGGKAVPGSGSEKGPAKAGGGMIDLGTLFTAGDQDKNKKK